MTVSFLQEYLRPSSFFYLTLSLQSGDIISPTLLPFLFFLLIFLLLIAEWTWASLILNVCHIPGPDRHFTKVIYPSHPIYPVNVLILCEDACPDGRLLVYSGDRGSMTVSLSSFWAIWDPNKKRPPSPHLSLSWRLSDYICPVWTGAILCLSFLSRWDYIPMWGLIPTNSTLLFKTLRKALMQSPPHLMFWLIPFHTIPCTYAWVGNSWVPCNRVLKLVESSVNPYLILLETLINV